MITLKTYNGQQDATFFIQCKGNNSGRPLKEPIPNCFAVYTDVPNAFEIVYGLFISKAFVRDIIGSVIPFIRKRDLMAILEPALSKTYKTQELDAVNLIDQQIANTLKKVELLKKLKIAVAVKCLKAGV